jgi:hypothetical protein
MHRDLAAIMEKIHALTALSINQLPHWIVIHGIQAVADHAFARNRAS